MEVDWIVSRSYPSSKPSRRTSTFKVVHEDEDIVVVYKPASADRSDAASRVANASVDGHDTLATQRSRRSRLLRSSTGSRPSRVCWVFARVWRLANGFVISLRPENPTTITLPCVSESGASDRDDSLVSRHRRRLESLFDRQLRERRTGDYSYEVKQAWDDASMLEIRLETGRRNQIRVHLAEAGHTDFG